MDSDGLLQCPYDKSHRIRPSRFPYHLVKCRENNPLAAKTLATCPYNARHKVPKNDLQMHMETCDYKVAAAAMAVVVQASPSTWQNPPSEETWDLDDSPRAAPFVLKDFGNSQPFDSITEKNAASSSKIPGLSWSEGDPAKGKDGASRRRRRKHK